MLIFYKNYTNCFIATMISVFGGACYVVAVGCLIGAFSDGGSDEMGGLILGAIALALLGFALGKWADHIASKKQKKIIAKQQASKSQASTNKIEKVVISSPIQETKTEDKPIKTEEEKPITEEIKVVSEPEKESVQKQEPKKEPDILKDKEAKTPDLEKNKDSWKCTKCGNINDSKFCKECGAPRPPKQKYCKNCGSKLEEGQKFCGDCGTKVT